MIQKLEQKDVEKLKTYISKDAVPNLFFRANIENYGLEGDKVEAFANTKEQDNAEWDFVLLRYFSIVLIYSQYEDYSTKEASLLINSFEKVDTIGGKHSVVEKLKNNFAAFTFRPTSLLRCTKESLIKDDVQNMNTKLIYSELPADKGDKLVDFFFTIKEFEHNYKGQEEGYRQRTKENLKKDSNAYIFSDNETIVASAMAGAQCSIGSMLLGVATNPNYRKQGLARILVTKACRDQFDKGKDFVALFFDNPEAASLYKKIGFEEVGGYTVLQNNT